VSDRQTCTACGHTGYDVSTRIVEREPTPEDPTPYAAEARCVDPEACDDRREERHA